MSKIIFLVLGIIIGGFLVVFILQNTVIVDVILLGFTVSMSRAIMLLIVLGLGVVSGWIIKSLFGVRKSGNKEGIKVKNLDASVY
jgi:hypothetical protein